MRWIEFVLILLFLSYIITTGKLSVLRYITQVLIKIFKIRQANEFIIKDRKEELFDLSMLYGTSYDNWMSQVERTKASINN